MKAIIVVAALFALALVASSRPEPACAACPGFPCTVSSQCGQGCGCLKIGQDTFGSCASF